MADAALKSHRHRLGVYKHEEGGYLIEIRLRDSRQLFNTLDPSPFHEKDLDAAAEQYIVSAVREIGARPSKLAIYLPAEAAAAEGRSLVLAIRHYFEYRAQHAAEQLHLLLWRGLISLAIGLIFLFACLWLRQSFDELGHSGRMPMISEGLLILGWVAMWRPVEIFLYDWWPVLGKRRLFTRIAGMAIEIRELPRVESDVDRNGAGFPTSVGELSIQQGQ